MCSSVTMFWSPFMGGWGIGMVPSRDARVSEGSVQLSGRQAPRIRAARTAAFFALSTPTVATGTPGGI